MSKKINYERTIFSKFISSGKIWDSDFVHLYFGSKALSRFKKYTKVKVLDIGCGAGGLTNLYLHKFPYRFWGIDVSRVAIDHASKRYKKISFSVSSAEKIPFPDNCFDIVMCVEVLEHTKYPQKVIDEISRVLKKNGLVYLTTPLEAETNTLIGSLFGSKGIRIKESSSGHVQLFDRKSLLRLFDRNFRVVNAWYDRIFIAQIVDFIYSLYLHKKNKKVLEISSVTGSGGLLLMRLINIITNTETLLLRKIPGLGWQVVLKKL